jgi:NAD(P)-dependent dehydrogenase (short-subunit alcohol dehydrogenase family)
MNIDLSGKTAVVSGSTGGIGFAIACGLAACGARVVINGRGTERVRAACDALAASVPGANPEGVAADLSTADGAALLAHRVSDPDILVNNFAAVDFKGFFDITDADWQGFFESNVLSGVRLSRSYLPGMMKRNWGRIVFISSESALNIPPDMIHYGATKTMQLAVSRGLAELTAGTGVTVNAVLPGPTLSSGFKAFLSQAAERSGRTLDELCAEVIKTQRPTSLLGRMASVEEVANMVVYTCSREASATNGAALRVDGGVLRSIA